MPYSLFIFSSIFFERLLAIIWFDSISFDLTKADIIAWAIFPHPINPIFLLPNKEPQYSKGYILSKLHKAKANEIIRNLLFAISPERKRIKKNEKTDKLIHIENSIKEILKIEDIKENTPKSFFGIKYINENEIKNNII